MRRLAAIDKQKSGAQMSLFGDIIEEEAPEVSYPEIPEWSTAELLSKEKSVLGVYVSGHPFGAYSAYFTDCTFHTGMLSDYEEDEETGDRTYQQFKTGDQVSMGGIVAAVRKINTKGGTIMAFVTVEDLYGSVECVAFPRVYEKIKPYLRHDGVVRLSGKIDTPAEKLPCIILDHLTEFVPPEEQQPAETHEETVREQVLWLDARSLSEEDFSELLETIAAYEGEVKTKILHGGKRYEFSVHLSRALTAELRSFLPANCVKLV